MEIKAGPELDQAVAEVLGLTWAGEPCVPKFSTDLNAAFKAALEVCDAGFGVNTAFFGSWERFQCVMSVGREDSQRQVETEAPTPALAICAAILKLKKGKDD